MIKRQTQKIIGIIIMSIAIIAGACALISSYDKIYDISIPVFLIGLIISDFATYKELRAYQIKYGELESD